MFSLIITIISILLVAALALAALYYGGAAFTKSTAQARAARMVTQGQQLMGAADLFRSDQGRWPTDLNELVTFDYLKQIPSASAMAAPTGIPVAMAAEAEWVMPTASVPTFELRVGVDEKTCREVNRISNGFDGILKQAYGSFTAQCYGGSVSALNIVVTKDQAALVSGLPAAEVAPGAVPTDPLDNGWLVAPGASESATPGDTTPTSPTVPTGVQVRGPVPIVLDAQGHASWALQGPGPDDGGLDINSVTARLGDAVVDTLSGVSCNDGYCSGYLSLVKHSTEAVGTLVKGSVTIETSAGVAVVPLQYTVTADKPEKLGPDDFIIISALPMPLGGAIDVNDDQPFGNWAIAPKEGSAPSAIQVTSITGSLGDAQLQFPVVGADDCNEYVCYGTVVVTVRPSGAAGQVIMGSMTVTTNFGAFTLPIRYVVPTTPDGWGRNFAWDYQTVRTYADYGGYGGPGSGYMLPLVRQMLGQNLNTSNSWYNWMLQTRTSTSLVVSSVQLNLGGASYNLRTDGPGPGAAYACRDDSRPTYSGANMVDSACWGQLYLATPPSGGGPVRGEIIYTTNQGTIRHPVVYVP